MGGSQRCEPGAATDSMPRGKETGECVRVERTCSARVPHDEELSRWIQFGHSGMNAFVGARR
jgi:hypothetical protein